MNLWQKIYNKTGMYGLNNIIKNEENYEYQLIKGIYVKVWKDGDLRDWVDTLKKLLKEFYFGEIKPKLLTYILVK